MSHRSVYCIVSSQIQARRIIHRLGEIAFPRMDVSVIFLEPAATAKARAAKSMVDSGDDAVAQTIAFENGSLVGTGPAAEFLSDIAIYGVAGGLREFGVPAAEAGRYEARIKAGHVFLSICTGNPDNSDRVRQIFADEGAEGVCTLMTVVTPNLSRRSAYQAR